MFIRQGMSKIVITYTVFCFLAVFLSIKLLNGQEVFDKNAGIDDLGSITQERDEKAGQYGLEDTNYPAPVEPFLNKENIETNAIGGWVITKVGQAGKNGGHTSLARDSLGKIHICFYDGTNLKYVTNASESDWKTETVDGADNVGMYASIALDAANKAHISYYDAKNSTLKYATNTSGSWATSIIDSNKGAGLYTSIALDTDGKAH
ncbi:MAG: hypothetical protein AABY76_04835, partial [Planctomycetota bacterium]